MTLTMKYGATTRSRSALKRRITAVAAGAMVVGAIGAVPAYAVSEVNWFDCNIVGGGSGGDYFRVKIQAPGDGAYQRCFANRGEKNIKQPYVKRFSSGNNEGWFIYNPGDGSEYKHTFKKNEVRDKWYGKIYELHIDR